MILLVLLAVILLPMVAVVLYSPLKRNARSAYHVRRTYHALVHITRRRRIQLAHLLFCRCANVSVFLVPVVGVEPTRYRYHWILSPARLPIPSYRRMTNGIIPYSDSKIKGFFKILKIFFYIFSFDKIKPRSSPFRECDRVCQARQICR